jgi:hypothetical protein
MTLGVGPTPARCSALLDDIGWFGGYVVSRIVDLDPSFVAHEADEAVFEFAARQQDYASLI